MLRAHPAHSPDQNPHLPDLSHSLSLCPLFIAKSFRLFPIYSGPSFSPSVPLPLSFWCCSLILPALFLLSVYVFIFVWPPSRTWKRVCVCVCSIINILLAFLCEHRRFRRCEPRAQGRCLRLRPTSACGAVCLYFIFFLLKCVAYSHLMLMNTTS